MCMSVKRNKVYDFDQTNVYEISLQRVVRATGGGLKVNVGAHLPFRSSEQSEERRRARFLLALSEHFDGTRGKRSESKGGSFSVV